MKRTPDFFSTDLDKKIRPQDDFFAYTNKGWLKKNPIPRTQVTWSTFSSLHDAVKFQLKDILEKLEKSHTADPGEKKLREYYRVAMDTTLINHLGIDPITEELARIDALDDRNEFPALLARLHNLGLTAFWDYAIDSDMKINTVNILYVAQDGLGLPDRDYYLKTDAKSKKVREEYLKAIIRLMKLAGWSQKNAAGAAPKIYAIEKKLAEASMSQVEQRDIPAMYNKMSVATLSKKTGFDWAAYCSAVGIAKKHQKSLIVCQPKFMVAAAAILKKTPLDDLKAYLSWHLIADTAPYLSDDIATAHFAFFQKTLLGRKEQEVRWKRVMGELDSMVGELLGKLYVKKYFPPAAKKRINTLIDDLFATYRARMTALPWMSVETIARAIAKLDAMKRKIGYPSKWESYATFKPDSSSFIAMHWSALKYIVQREIKKLDKPVDRTTWGMNAHTVNAYCDIVFNEIVFPAGILQKPFFDPNWSDALNYGGIGSVIGHELTHAFDDVGSGFDKEGNLKNWWAKGDKKKFEIETKKLAKQYSQYTIIDDLKCNGELTLGENIADIGGLAIAYEALERRLGKNLHAITSGGFTAAQQFFIAYAQTECGAYRPEAARLRAMTDPHAPSELRVNVAPSNLQEFHDAFDIKPGDKLYRKHEDRVSIW